jgi:hypothetical protein
MIDLKLMKPGDKVRNIKGGFIETFQGGAGDTFTATNSLDRDVVRFCRDYEAAPHDPPEAEANMGEKR